MTTAYLSPRAKLALRKEGDGWSALTYEKCNSGWQPVSPSMLWSLQNYDDFATIHVSSDDELKHRLIDAVDESEAVDLTLMLLDGRLPDSTRLLAAEELEEVVRYAEIRERLEFLFATQPLPEDAFLDSACTIAAKTCPAATEFLNWLTTNQENISASHRAWKAAWDGLSLDARVGKSVRAAFLQLGVFRDVAVTFRTPGGPTTSLMKWAGNQALKLRCPQAVGVLKAWLQPASHSKAFASRFAIEESAEDDEAGIDLPAYPSAVGGRRGGRMRAHEAKAKVDRMIDHLYGLMAKRHLAAAADAIDQLVDFQCQNDGHGAYAAQSLCKLAGYAEELGLARIEDDLTRRAVELAPRDAIALSQRGHSLKRQGKFIEAIAACNAAIAFAP
ncbi:MAG: hypothetical protein SFV23_16255, partial [Planctomycetaceae bacterium]|nr:hypothetical protein [Planctomycetaceae bacterium]